MLDHGYAGMLVDIESPAAIAHGGFDDCLTTRSLLESSVRGHVGASKNTSRRMPCYQRTSTSTATW